MSKVKQPLLGLGAKGSLAGSISFATRRGVNILENKPIPTDPKTLAQIYQRWDYQDGILRWHALTNAQKRTWHSNATRFHMTGFAYYMRWFLSTLSPLLCRWHLDEVSGNQAADSSKFSHHGTIFGTLPIIGRIDSGRSFDGIDDYISVAHSATLNNPICFETWVRPIREETVEVGYWAILAKQFIRRNGLYLGITALPDQFAVWFHDGIGYSGAGYSIPIFDVWYHVVGQFEDNRAKLYVNGVFIAQGVALTGPPPLNAAALTAGGLAAVLFSYAHIDECAAYSEPLPLYIIQQHAARRYPL